MLGKERIFECSLILNYSPFSLNAASHSLSPGSKELSVKTTCLSHSKVQELSSRVCSWELAWLKQNQTAGLDFSREDTCHYSKEKYVFHWTLPSQSWQLHEQEGAGLTDCAILKIMVEFKLPVENLFNRIIYRRALFTWVFLWSLVEWITWLFESLLWEGQAGGANLEYSLL